MIYARYPAPAGILLSFGGLPDREDSDEVLQLFSYLRLN